MAFRSDISAEEVEQWMEYHKDLMGLYDLSLCLYGFRGPKNFIWAAEKNGVRNSFDSIEELKQWAEKYDPNELKRKKLEKLKEEVEALESELEESK